MARLSPWWILLCCASTRAGLPGERTPGASPRRELPHRHLLLPGPAVAPRHSDASRERERRMYRGTTTPDVAYTPLSANPYYQSTLPTSTTTTTTMTTLPSDFIQYYDVFPRSAISMNGKSYYVNYDKPIKPLNDLLKECYLDEECVAFDYDASKGYVEGQGWMHRIVAICAHTAGAQYSDESSDSTTTFYQLKVERLEEKDPKLHGFVANMSDPTYRTRIRPGVEKAEVTELCNGKYGNTAELIGSPDAASFWLRAFGAFVGILVGSALLVYGAVEGMQYTLDRHELNRVLNRDLVPDEADAFDDDGETSEDEDEPDQQQAQQRQLLPQGRRQPPRQQAGQGPRRPPAQGQPPPAGGRVQAYAAPQQPAGGALHPNARPHVEM